MVTPAANREAVTHLEGLFEVSQRRACDVLRVDRKMVGITVGTGMMQASASGCGRLRRIVGGSAIFACTGCWDVMA